MASPNITYNSIKLNGVEITLGGQCRASFTAPYNQVDITMTPDTSLSNYKVMITSADEDYDIEVGQCAYWGTSIPSSVAYKFSIPINRVTFNKGDGLYRVSLYAQNMLDGLWDVTYIFMVLTAEGSGQWEQLDPYGSEEGIEVHVDTQLTVYSITPTLNNCTAFAGNMNKISTNERVTLGYHFDGVNYECPDTIATISGVTYTWRKADTQNGILELSNPTKNITFTISGKAK